MAKTALVEVPKGEERPSIWTRFRVRWSFLTPTYGSTPADPEIVAKWLEARKPATKPLEARSIQQINEEVIESLGNQAAEEESDFSVLQFQRHEGALVKRLDTVRAHLKECARTISAQYAARMEGERAFSTKFINGVYLDERQYWIPILREGVPLTESDGFVDRAVHVRGPRGEQLNALKRIEVIRPPCEMEFTIKVLGRVISKKGKDGAAPTTVNTLSVAEDDLRLVMEYGGVHGYGGERGADGGKYDFEIERAQ